MRLQKDEMEASQETVWMDEEKGHAVRQEGPFRLAIEYGGPGSSESQVRRQGLDPMGDLETEYLTKNTAV